MPFGLTNAPATFQMTMNEAFRSILDKCVIVYLDDILIYNPVRAQQLQDIEAVFQILSENRLLTKASKCEFLQDRLEFLGHIISAEGVEIDPKKIATIQAWHAPTNLTELQSFMGFVNYVRRFVPDMAKLIAPLTDLLRKGVEYTWGEKEQAAFSALENILCSPPVLHIADPHRPFELVTDASDIAVGAVLLQDFGNGLQPIAYESCKLHPPERNYPIHDRKMLAIVHAFKVWRCYLTGADVIVRTDHRSLQYLRAQPNLNPRQIHWLDYLESNFIFMVTYKKGASNIADALTRPSAQLHAILLAQTNPLLTGLFTHGYSTDPFFTTGNSQQLAEARGIYYIKRGTNRIWVPAYSLLRELLLQEAHDGITSGHFGVEKTQQQLQRYYYWPELLTNVQHHVGSCPTCQVMKSSRKRKAGMERADADAFKRYKLLKIAMGEEKIPEEREARDRWIEKSAVLYDLILQLVNNDMFQNIKDLVELDDSGPKAWKLLRDVIQPNTLAMVIVSKKELAALSMRQGDDVKAVLEKIKDIYAMMAAAGSKVSEMQKCTKIVLVLDNLLDNLIPIMCHTGGGAANKTAEGYGAALGSRGRGGGRGRGRGRGFGRGRGRGDYNDGHGSSGAQGDGAQGKADPGMFLMVEDVKGSEGAVGAVVMHPLTHYVIDSDSTSHMTLRTDLLDEVKPLGKIKFVAAASGASLPMIGVGNAKEKSSCIKDLWQLPIFPSNGKPPATTAAVAMAKATAGGEETSPTDGALDEFQKVQQPQQPHGEVLAGVDATAARENTSSSSGEADWETWHERLCHVNFPML
ncbi:unnamed protein product [Closterium sp. NIES-54]